MTAIVWTIVVILLIIVLIWPWFLIIVGFMSLLLAWQFRQRTNKKLWIPPLWTWGNTTNDVIIKIWTIKPIQLQLCYKLTSNKRIKNRKEHNTNREEKKKNRTEFKGSKGKNKWNYVDNSFDADLLKSTDAIVSLPNTRHRFKINGLSTGRFYEYMFVQKETSQVYLKKENFTFYTPDETSNVSKFVVCGDSQQSEVLALLETFMWRKMRKEDPDFILYLGDHVHYHKEPRLWFAFFRMMRKIFPKIPFYPTLGNHCGGAGTDKGKTVGFTFQLAPDILEDHQWDYTWHHKLCYFISLNSLPVLQMDREELKKQEQWLKEKIENKPASAKYTIVYMHVPWIGPPYMQNGEKYTPYEIYLKKNWKPILDTSNVDVVFSGHKHSYVREGKYFISASIHGVRKYEENDSPEYKVKNGHHYLIVDVNESKMKITAKSMLNKILDEFTIEK